VFSRLVVVRLLAVLPTFALTALVLAMVPGQGVAMVLRQTLVGGPRAGYLSVLGNSLGLVLWGVASAIGLSQVFAHSPLAYNVLKYAGVAYLSFLALQTLVALRRETGAFNTAGRAATRPFAAVRLGLVTNLTNVKAAVFAVAFIPQFVPRSVSLGVGVATLALVQSLVSTTWYVALVTGVHRATTLLARPRVRRALTAVSAIGLLGLAAALLLTSPR
jgi:threonine/homoserine/homoserine lactone efflux protein